MPAYKSVLLVCCAWIAGGICVHLWHTPPSALKPAIPKNTYHISHTPRHMAIIMDGNRRWAKERGLPPWIGHEYGIQPLKEVIRCCIEHNIPYLSVYAFSIENFKRPQQEQQYLFDIISKRLVHDELPELNAQGVRINIIGDRRYFPQSLINDIAYVEKETRNNTRLTLNLLFCYSGRHDIAQAVQSINTACLRGEISQQDITPERISQHLFTHTIPDPDLVIRTGGRQRISNFLLYQVAYSEIYFLPIYWPDISKDDILSMLERFSATTRTFGG